MKKYISSLLLLALMVGCDSYVDSEINAALNEVVQGQNELTESVSSLEDAVDALESRLNSFDEITSIEAILDEGGNLTGYTISFAQSADIKLYYGINGEDGTNGSSGSDGTDGTIVSIEITEEDGSVTITLDNNAETTYTFPCTKSPSVTISFAETVAALTPEENSITATVSGTITSITASVIDEDGGSGMATKVDISPSMWKISITDGDEENTYDITLTLLDPQLKETDGILTVTVIDDSGISYSESLPFIYTDVDAVDSYSIAEIAAGIVPSGTEWIISDVTIESQAHFYALRDLLQNGGYSDGSISLSFPYLLSDIPLGATYSEGVFYQCYALGSVSMPYVESIGNWTFRECSNLATISLPKVTTIGIGAFKSCSSLTGFDFPKATSLGANAFDTCTSLTEVVLSEGVETIEANTFNECTNLTTISAPNVETIGNYAFFECTNLTTISAPNVETIGDRTFYKCTSLTSITLATSSTLTSVGSMILYNVTTSNTTLTIGAQNESVVNINGNKATFGGTTYTFAEINMVQQ